MKERTKSAIISSDTIIQLACGVLIFLSFAATTFFYDTGVYFYTILFLLTPFIAELYFKRADPFINAGYNITGLVVIVIPFGLLNLMAFPAGIELSELLVLPMILMIWTNDIFAYFTGLTIGKHKLFERISPKKTWEGFFGGLAGCLIFGWLYGKYFETVDFYIGMALVVSVFGTLGDLVESMLKRSLRIKDSGTILPGHGGFLDRFDALLFATPAVFVYTRIVYGPLLNLF